MYVSMMSLPKECRDFTIASIENFPKENCYQGVHTFDLYNDIYKGDKEYRVLITNRLLSEFIVVNMKPMIKINKETKEETFLWRTMVNSTVNNLEGADGNFAIAYAFKEADEKDKSSRKY